MESNGWSLARIGGFCGLAFAAGVLLQNAVLLAGNPLPDASLDEIQSFYVDGAGRISVAVGLVALNIVFLVLFGSAVSRKLASSRGSEIAARAALAGIVLLGGAFLVTTFLQAVLVARVEALAAAGQLQMIWDLHTAAFAMSGSGLGVTLAALSAGALMTDSVVPRWTALLGFFGAVCVIAAGALVVSTIEGGPGIWLQLAGFGTWLIWLVAASLRLLRGEAAPVQARTA
ncbi:MAG: hypothetical protein QNJ77_08360 [Acidimicrobiia bacterium]|nr:hypothetical protein [Acidimicrobiia bacterium]